VEHKQASSLPEADFFALLEQPRRPWLDQQTLKSKYLELSAKAHPDRLHQAPPDEKAAANQKFAALNTAFQCLSQPKLRLRHLLALEMGRQPSPIEQLPSEWMDYYFTIAQQCREADRFLADNKDASSPLLQVQKFESSMVWSERLGDLRQKLDRDRAALLDELAALNRFWEAAPEISSVDRLKTLPLARLEQIYRTLSYLERWLEQIQQRLVRLSI
jgi:curved DNA-binding protein CbpA